MFFNAVTFARSLVLKTVVSDLGFQHLPRDLANVNACKTMFDPYIGPLKHRVISE